MLGRLKMEKESSLPQKKAAKKEKGKNGFEHPFLAATKVTAACFVYVASAWPWLILEGSDCYYRVSPYARGSRDSVQMQAPWLLSAKLPWHSHLAKPRIQTGSWWAIRVTHATWNCKLRAYLKQLAMREFGIYAEIQSCGFTFLQGLTHQLQPRQISSPIRPIIS